MRRSTAVTMPHLEKYAWNRLAASRVWRGPSALIDSQVHRNILAGRSRWFKKAFFGDFKVSKPSNYTVNY